MTAMMTPPPPEVVAVLDSLKKQIHEFLHEAMIMSHLQGGGSYVDRRAMIYARVRDERATGPYGDGAVNIMVSTVGMPAVQAMRKKRRSVYRRTGQNLIEPDREERDYGGPHIGDRDPVTGAGE